MKYRAINAVILGALIAGSAGGMSKLSAPAEVFDVNGKSGFVMSAEQPAEGKPWVWYAPTLAAYPNARHKFYFDKLLQAGIAIAGYDLGEVRGAPESSRQFTEFYEAMVAKGYSPKPVLLGQSRGGLMLLCWAFRNPDKVRAFVGIYPVCNITSWPLLNSKAAVLADYKLTEEALLQQLKDFNPPENLAELAKKQVPMFILHGDSDTLVPYRDNSELIKAAYTKAGGEITVKIIPGKGHAEIPEFFEDSDLVEFIVNIHLKK